MSGLVKCRERQQTAWSDTGEFSVSIWNVCSCPGRVEPNVHVGIADPAVELA